MTQPDVLEVTIPVNTVTEVITESIVEVAVDAPRGPAGPAGVAGPRGPAGASGTGSGLYLAQSFASPQSTWVVDHEFGAYPVVTLVDLNDDEISGDIEYTDLNHVTVTYAYPMAGTARLRT